MKQIDRLLSNEGIAMELMLQQWVRFVVGTAPSVVIVLVLPRSVVDG